MGFIRNLLRNREKSQLEEALVKDPSPSIYLRLARIYQEEGDLAKAAQIAKRGAARFPEHAEIGTAEQDLVRQDRQAEMKRLRDRINNYPNPRLYSRLAELLRAAGDAAQARSVLAQGLRNYPKYGGLYYVLGLLERDEDKNDEALENLIKATELDNYNYAALKMLGTVYSDLNRHSEAAAAYDKIMSFAPDDEEIQELRTKALLAAGLPDKPRKVSPVLDTRVMPTEEIAATAKKSDAAAPAGGKQASSPTAETKALSAAADTELAEAMARLSAAADIEGAVLVDNYGLPVASAVPEGTEEGLAAAMTTGLRRSGSPACGEMGLGSFDEMVVESAEGSIYVYALREMTLAVFAAHGAKAGLVERHVREFAEKALDLH
jgi:predicted regulator of Ras-like GTPase activity (Roadblock/LC7/MglB family)